MEYVGISGQHRKTAAPEDDHIAMHGECFQYPVEHLDDQLAPFSAFRVEFGPESQLCFIFLFKFYKAVFFQQVSDDLFVYKMIAQTS